MKTFATRSLSAAVFVIVLLGSVQFHYYSFCAFFLIVSIIGLFEFYRLSEPMGARPFKLTGHVLGILIFLLCAIQSSGRVNQDLSNWILAALTTPVFLILAIATFSKEVHSLRSAFFTVAGIFYAVLPFALLSLCAFQEKNGTREFEPRIILGVIFLIWSNDTFAYLGGSLLGRNKMIERISPGKTWEGTAVGLLLSLALSFFFDKWLIPLGSRFNLWPVLGVVVPILSTVGDLVESKLKRDAGVKDSGHLMPGHGGVLDRFDSLIFVAPFLYLLMHC